MVPGDELRVHALLIEGSGSEALKSCINTRFKSSGQVTWVQDGSLVRPRFEIGSQFRRGDEGDFEKSQPFSFGAWIKRPNISGSHSILARMDQDQAFRGWDLWHENGSVGVHIVDQWPEKRPESHHPQTRPASGHRKRLCNLRRFQDAPRG